MLEDLDPRDLVDRQAEQELFRGIVGPMIPSAARCSARMLTICDRGGRGKSSLLKRLLYNCQYEIQPPASGARRA